MSSAPKCERCGGSGIGPPRRDPDADIPNRTLRCPACHGTGRAEGTPTPPDALDEDDVGGLCYRGNSVSFIYDKLAAYSRNIQNVNNALREGGMVFDGNKSNVDLIGELVAALREARAERDAEIMGTESARSDAETLAGTVKTLSADLSKARAEVEAHHGSYCDMHRQQEFNTDQPCRDCLLAEARAEVERLKRIAAAEAAMRGEG